MGYYVSTGSVDIFLDKKHFESVYNKMCELNNYDELKRGGSFGANNDQLETDKYNKSKWFSWMAYNYPETCKNMQEILDALGFDWTLDTDGNLIDISYADKTGSEDYFMSCFAGFIKDGSYIEWNGEETDDRYKYLFQDGKMFYQRGTVEVVYNESDSEEYVFGQLNGSDRIAAEWISKMKEEKEKEKENG